jgi:hypothetical protein
MRLARSVIKPLERPIAIFVVTVLGVAVALLAWHPWSGTANARAVASPARVIGNVIIPKPIGDISAPPPYPIDQAQDHCAQWNHWFEGQGAAEPGGGLGVEILAPSQAAVAITGVTVHVFRSYKPRGLSYIKCDERPPVGYDLVPALAMGLSLAHPSAAPTINSGGVTGDRVQSFASPSGALIRVLAGTTERLHLVPSGSRVRMYEWSVDLSAVVNQRRETLQVGSAREPLRSWFGPNPRRAYDYDLAKHAWRRVPVRRG